MTIQYAAEIHCDKCGEWMQVAVGCEQSVRGRKFAARQGWVTKRVPLSGLSWEYQDLCPNCQEKSDVDNPD